MVAVENLSKSFGAQVLFDRVGFKVNRKERVGVVGRNGHGKTTLFRMILGEEEPDSGMVAIPKGYRIGYVEQEPNFTEPTTLAEAAKGLPPEASFEIWRVEKILAGLGFEKKNFDQPPSELSGGFQVRLNLAKVLLAEYNLLLLDEPNNYLDITSIRWLSRYLQSWPGELMLITHDRGFMDGIVTHILGIHRKKVRKIKGDTGKYYAQIALDEEVYEKTRLNDERKRKEIEAFINQFIAKARLVGLVQSRIKTLSKMEKKEKLEKIQTLDFSFKEKPSHAKYALSVSHLSFSYEPANPLIRDFSIHVGAKDRIFVIGKNGQGKTTLLKLLAGVLKPDRGDVSSPAAVAAGYYEQTFTWNLGQSNTVLEEIASADPGLEPQRVRTIAGAMMFEGEDSLKKISILSGGEKSRVVLGKLIATPLNLLLLDEPTNHFDLESADALLAAIDNFDGAVVMVTHNEMFLHALAERLIIFQDHGIQVFEGNYQRFLEKVGWREEGEAKIPAAQEEGAIADKERRRSLRRLRSDVMAERSRILRPLEMKIAELEKSIDRAESELAHMNEEIVRASRAKESSRIVELSKGIRSAKEKVDRLFSELEKATTEYEKIKPEFDKRLASLEEPPG